MAKQEQEIGIRKILPDIKKYNAENLKKIDEAALRLQKEMLEAVKADTPVNEENEGEHLKDQWEAKPYGATGRKVGSTQYNGAVYSVRAKKKYQIVHLLNFPHRIIAWGNDTERTSTPVMFMPMIRDEYQEKLNKEIERILK